MIQLNKEEHSNTLSRDYPIYLEEYPIYLDNASTTRISKEVLEEMMPFLTKEYGNAGTIYSLGRKAKEAVDIARERVARFLNAEPAQIIFTSGGTEANNMVFAGLAPYLININKKHIITSAVEHESVLRSVENLCIKHGFYATKVCGDGQCRVTPNSIREVLKSDKENIGLVSAMYVNNETGAINPVNLIGSLCKSEGLLFHTDCVQAAASSKIDVQKIGCDFASISSHKIHGPKGVGALYVKEVGEKSLLSPLIFGGLKQESGMRGGTENIAGIVGFGKACEMASENSLAIAKHTCILKNVFMKELRNNLHNKGLQNVLHINSDVTGCSSKILNISIDGVDSETMLLMLDSKGVFVSSGSACNNNQSEPSHVLVSMGIPEDHIRSAIRVSFSQYNYIEEVKRAAQIFTECISQLLMSK